MAVQVESEEGVPEPGPLCDEPEFAELIAGMVSDAAPRVFALVAERGERVDAAVFAWGLSFEDHAVLVGPGNSHGRFRSAESAHRLHTPAWSNCASSGRRDGGIRVADVVGKQF